MESKNICTLFEKLGADVVNAEDGFHGYKHLGKEAMESVLNKVVKTFNPKRNKFFCLFIFSHGGKDEFGEFLSNGVSKIGINTILTTFFDK